MLPTPRTQHQPPPHRRTYSRPHNRRKIPAPSRLQQRPTQRPTHQRRKPNRQERHAQPRPGLGDVVRQGRDGGREERLEGGAEDAVEHAPGVVRGHGVAAEPGEEDDYVYEDAD